MMVLVLLLLRLLFVCVFVYVCVLFISLQFGIINTGLFASVCLYCDGLLLFNYMVAGHKYNAYCNLEFDH